MVSCSFVFNDVYDVLEKPYQPHHLSFPAHQFGKPVQSRGLFSWWCKSSCIATQKRAPRHLEIGTSEGSHPASMEDHYRMVYYEALDLVVQGNHRSF